MTLKSIVNKNIFWRFVLLWVNLALLNPIKSFSWRGCVVQATKSKEKSCTFLDAIGHRSCGTLSGLAKNKHVDNPSFDSSGSSQLVGTLRCALSLSSHLHFNSRSSLACLSSACILLGMLLKARFTPAVSSVQSLTPPPPPTLSISGFEKKNHFRLTRQSEHPSEILLNVGTRSRSPGFPQLPCRGWFKRKSKEIFLATSSCVLWISNDLRLVAALGNYMLRVTLWMYKLLPWPKKNGHLDYA